MISQEAIKLNNINKYFGAFHVLQDISMSVSFGSSLGLLGPNGAGKSTLIKIMVGILPQTSGNLWIMNEQFTDKSAHNCQIKQNIGYLPELPSIYPELRVKDFLKFITHLRKIKPAIEEVNRVANMCGLQKVLKSKIGEISKGFKQRLGLAQVLIGSPKILILDEVASGLDPQQRTQIIELLRKEVSNGKTIIFSSHSIEDSLKISDRIILLNNGRISKEFTINKNEIEQQSIKNEITKGFGLEAL
ncbi:MAG: ABC transporter ATP-binding protein [Pseudomonadota bacterium]